MKVQINRAEFQRAAEAMKFAKGTEVSLTILENSVEFQIGESKVSKIRRVDTDKPKVKFFYDYKDIQDYLNRNNFSDIDIGVNISFSTNLGHLGHLYQEDEPDEDDRTQEAINFLCETLDTGDYGDIRTHFYGKASQ